MDVDRNVVGFLAGTAIWAAALLTFSFSNTLTPLGYAAVAVGFCLGTATMFVMSGVSDAATSLVGAVRFGVIPGVVAALVVMAATGVFGSLTTQSGQSPDSTFQAEQASLTTSYTGRITVLPVETGPVFDAPGCFPFETTLPSGVTVSNDGSTCVVTIDWSKNSVLALPTQGGVNALNHFDSDVRDQGKVLVLHFPETVRVDLFVHNADESAKARSLPDWALQMAPFTAVANRH